MLAEKNEENSLSNANSAATERYWNFSEVYTPNNCKSRKHGKAPLEFHGIPNLKSGRK